MATATLVQTVDIDLGDSGGDLAGRLAITPTGAVKGLVLFTGGEWVPFTLTSISTWASWTEARLAGEYHRSDGPTAVLGAATKPVWYVVTVQGSGEESERYPTYEAARRVCGFAA